MLTATFGVDAVSVSRILMREAEGSDSFWAVREAGAAGMTKDRDFVELADVVSSVR